MSSNFTINDTSVETQTLDGENIITASIDITNEASELPGPHIADVLIVAQSDGGETVTILTRNITLSDGESTTIEGQSTVSIGRAVTVQFSVNGYDSESVQTSQRVTVDATSQSGDGSTPEPTVGQTTELTEFGEVRPTIESLDGATSLQPPVVTRAGGTLPLDTNTTQGWDGRTFTNSNGDLNVRYTLEGWLFPPSFQSLTDLLLENKTVRIITDGYTGTVEFDQFKWDRKSDNQRGRYSFDGESIQGPLWTFQLQTKQNSDGGDSGLFNLG